MVIKNHGGDTKMAEVLDILIEPSFHMGMHETRGGEIISLRSSHKEWQTRD